jgi:tyrosyl-tRNA synthetase
MSKSLGNYIAITDTADDMFGKIMSASDVLMWRYYELLSDRPMVTIHTLHSQVDSGAVHPMEAKKSLAAELVTRFHGTAAAETARNYFESRFQRKITPSEIQQRFEAPEPIWICRLMVEVLKFAKSTSDARRLIAQGAVKVDGQVIQDVNFQFHALNHEILEVGKNRIAQAQKIL